MKFRGGIEMGENDDLDRLYFGWLKQISNAEDSMWQGYKWEDLAFCCSWVLTEASSSSMASIVPKELGTSQATGAQAMALG